MADIVSAVIAAADLIHTIVTSSLFKDLGSTDIGDYESDAKMLALNIKNITDKLYNVDEQKTSDTQKEACELLRVAVLDAEDILDRVETLIKKKKLMEVNDKVTRETNDKELCSSVYASIKSFANKARDILFSGGNKSDEVHNAIKEINKKLDVVEKNIKSFGLHEPTSRGLSRKFSARASGSQVNAQTIMGRNEDKAEIIKLLLKGPTNKERIPVVSVVGMGGMGKTTLAQLVYDDKSWQKEYFDFDLLLWVPDSKKLDLRLLLKSILKCIKPSDTSLDSLEETHLKDRLVEEIRDKRFFLVLDDVENESRLSWGNVEDLLSKGNMEGSRVLVTTRSRTVALAMGSSDSTYPLKGLSEEDSLQLFERCAFEGMRDENLVEIGEIIVRKCAGVPLALKVIGTLLFDHRKDKRKWERFRDYGLAEDNSLMPILKMSFDDLDPILKQCFSYCALFPKNYHISKQKLSRIWMANVRLKTKKGENLRDTCDKNLKLLFRRCFLEVAKRETWDDDDVTHYKMHDLMHDLAKEVAGAEMVVADSNMLIIEENVRHLCLMSSRTLELKGRRLRTFTGSRWGSDGSNAEKLVSGCPFLRFLELRRCKIGNLTKSIGELIHLRYLKLSDCEFETLDSITELINLQHLTLKRCNDMAHLPSKMSALASLEVLHISECDELTELPEDIQRLTKLRHLKLKECDALTHLPSEMGGLTSLEVLDVSECGKFKELPKGIQRLTKLKCLLLDSWAELTNLPSGMGALISLEVLDVSNCGKLKELPEDIQRLTKLKCLKLANCCEITHLPSGIGALTSLQVLDIARLWKLQELPVGIEKLTNLKDLDLTYCSGLTQMPSGMGALVSVCTPPRLIVGHPESKHTVQLEELASVSELKHGGLEIQLPYNITSKTPAGVAYLFNKKSLRKLEIEWKKEDDTEEEKEVPTNHRDILAKLQPPLHLEEFTLKVYQGVTFPAWVPKDGFGSVLPNLVKIQIVSCNGYRNLPALSRLASLKHMELWDLSSLEYIEEDVSSTSFFPSLEKLILEELPELKGWCRGEGLTADTVEQEQSLMLPSFPCLLDLKIEGCPNLKVEAILVSFVKVFSVKSTGEMEKELSEKREETMSSSGKPLALSSSSLALFVAICRDGAQFQLSMEEENHGHSLQFYIRGWKASGLKSIDMDNAFRQISKHLTNLDIMGCSGLKNLTGLQHLTALQRLGIWECDDFTGEEDEEEGKQMKSNSVQTLESSSSTCLEAASTQYADNQWKSLQSLQFLYFSRLPKMKALPQGIQFLTSLEELNIEYCDNLTVPEWVHTTFKHEDNGLYGVQYQRI